MKHLEDHMEQLAARAQAEVIPVGNVSAKVIRRLHNEEAVVPNAPLTLFAAGYAAVAATALIFGVSLLNTLNDPLAAMFEFGMGISP